MNKTKEEETYIGNLKFFDSVVNNFGFVGSVRNSNEVIKDDVHIERKDLLHEPELYNDNMLVFLKILEGDRGLKGYDVSLLNKHSLKEIIPFFPLLDRSLFEEFSGLEYKAERIECVAILEKKIKSEINESLKEDLCKALKQMPHEYHDLIADVDSEEFLNLVKSKEILPPNYLLKLSKIDPDGFLSAIKSKVDYMSDVEKWAFIKESKSKKVAKKLLDSWKFENSYFPSGFVGLLQGENLSKKNIPNFYKNMNKSILKEEGYSQISSLREVKDIISINLEFIKGMMKGIQQHEIDNQLLILDICQDIQLCKPLIDNWLTEKPSQNWLSSESESVEAILNWLKENDGLLKKNKTKTNQLKTSLKKWFSQSEDSHRILYLRLCPSDLLIDVNDVLKSWEFNENIDTVDYLIDYLSEQPKLTLPEVFIKKLKNYFSNNAETNDILKTIAKSARLLESPSLLLKFLEDYTSNPELCNEASRGGYMFIPEESKGIDLDNDEFGSLIEELSITKTESEYAGLINFWRIILRRHILYPELDLPEKELMYDFFESMPSSLQLLFFKALVKYVYEWEGSEYSNDKEVKVRRRVFAQYLVDFNFTDLSCNLLKVLLHHRGSEGINDTITSDLKNVLMESLTDTEKVPNIGYLVKQCNGRKFYSGDIQFDNNKKTYSFWGAFYKEVNYEYSPDRFSDSSDSIDYQDMEDLPF